jgi:hypothetical protein
MEENFGWHIGYLSDADRARVLDELRSRR